MDQCLLRRICDSEVAVPADDPVQVNAAVWSDDERPRREVGVESVLVFSVPVWAAARLHLHPGKRQWYARVPQTVRTY